MRRKGSRAWPNSRDRRKSPLRAKRKGQKGKGHAPRRAHAQREAHADEHRFVRSFRKDMKVGAARATHAWSGMPQRPVMSRAGQKGLVERGEAQALFAHMASFRRFVRALRHKDKAVGRSSGFCGLSALRPSDGATNRPALRLQPRLSQGGVKHHAGRETGFVSPGACLSFRLVARGETSSAAKDETRPQSCISPLCVSALCGQKTPAGLGRRHVGLSLARESGSV